MVNQLFFYLNIGHTLILVGYYGRLSRMTRFLLLTHEVMSYNLLTKGKLIPTWLGRRCDIDTPARGTVQPKEIAGLQVSHKKTTTRSFSPR